MNRNIARLLICFGFVLGIVHGQWEQGDPLCPCIEEMPELTAEEVAAYTAVWKDGETTANESAWSDGSVTPYGIGCANHDLGTAACSAYQACVDETESNILKQENELRNCPNAWCARSWCFVDTNNCEKLESVAVSELPPNKNLSYSYAACGQVDYFESEARFSSLRDHTFRVGFNHNSGGWTGAYSRSKQHFDGPGSDWYGPAVDFVREAAQVGNFRINLTAPPEKLLNASIEYFSSSRFDYCIYATGLGYLDFCVASYTITNKRALAAEWFILDSLSLYLVTHEPKEVGGVETFKNNFLSIFKPFSRETWLLIMFGFLPFLAFLMMTQELGAEGSDFPTTEKKLVENDNAEMPPDEKEVTYPMWKNVNRALYRGFLSYLRRAYGQPVQTYGASWTVLAYCFIGMIGMSLYTAQMAAHLTTGALEVGVDNLGDAIRAGYRFCGERKNVELIMTNFNIKDRFVRDPIDLGGDGEPGFNCPGCNARERTIKFLDPEKARTDDRYCHAAVASLEELEILQADGMYCNLQVSGQPLAYKQFGFPLSSQYAKALRSLFITMKNNGVYRKNKFKGFPRSSCAPVQPKAKSLTPYDLVGIWITCIGFVIIGIVVSFIERRKALKGSAKVVAKETAKLSHRLIGSSQLMREEESKEKRTETAASNSVLIK